MNFKRLSSWGQLGALVAISALVLLPRDGSGDTPVLECTLLSELPDDGTPLALVIQTSGSKKEEPGRAEAACRAALATDPANPTFMFQLARALTLGKKPLEAIKYYLDAADRGHAGAMNDLAGVFEYGLGLPKNLATAIEWYQRAAELGHAGAMSHLGQLSENGLGTPQDFAKARQWYEKAATLGNAASMNSLGDLLRKQGDLLLAVQWYVKAAQLGLATAMNNLGELSEAGMGVPQDYAIARRWYDKAAELGNADAMGNLGELFETGWGGPQDLEVARKWYVKGAALNGRVAMHHLGTLLEAGRGTPKNLSEAKVWYERAAALEYPPALNDLGRLYLTGVGVPKNFVRAKNLFEQAAMHGNAAAMNNLGMLYLNGRGVQKDINIARSWFERAIALNNVEAQENLRRLEQIASMDPGQIANRRTSCMQTCAALHRSYISVCDHYSADADGEKPEHTKCIDMLLSVSKQCRDSCREWASTLLTENKCLACFQDLLACSLRPEVTNNEGERKSYTAESDICIAALANCRLGCNGRTLPLSRTSE